MPRKFVGGSSSTAPKPDFSKSTYRPKKGYKVGGDFDPVVVESQRIKRNQAAARTPRISRMHEKAIVDTKWKRNAAGVPDNAGAMVRTKTYNPKLAVAREKVQALRKKRGA